MASAALRLASDGAAHPNDLDRKRIERALESRRRYRYVSPVVMPALGGYRIVSPCCSRNIDPDGGVVDVALICHDPKHELWKLFWKNHLKGEWELHSVHDRLMRALDLLNADSERIFWQ